MPLRPSIRRFIGPAFWIAVVICAFIPARWCGFTRPLHNIISAAVNPPARVLSIAGSALRNRNDQPIIDRDLQRLSAEVQRLGNLVIRYQDENEKLRADNLALQELKHTLGDKAYLFRLAQVMSRSTSPTNRAITLNIGSRAGAAAGLAVLSGPNLVGRLASAGTVTSDAQLITSAGQKLEAVLMPVVWPNGKPPEERKKHHVLFQADGTEFLVADDVPLNTPVEIGDVAHLQDDAWPADAQGMVLGRVVQITPLSDPVLRKKIVIRPLRALVYLDQVTVIVPRKEE